MLPVIGIIAGALVFGLLALIALSSSIKVTHVCDVETLDEQPGAHTGGRSSVTPRTSSARTSKVCRNSVRAIAAA